MPPNSDPFLSVVVPTYDEPVLLLETLSSLGRQQYPVEEVEIVVVDDGSTPPANMDELHGLVEPFTLRLYRHEENLGRAKARNAGIRCSRGNVVIFLDGDMSVEPGFFRAHALFHQANDSKCGCVGNIRFAAEIRPNALSRYIEGRGVHQYASGERVPFNCFVTGNSSLRRQVVIDAGLFDEDFREYGGEDLEFGYRLSRSGVRFYYEDSAVSNHHELRTWSNLCDLMRVYGRASVPLILNKHPELVSVLRIPSLETKDLFASLACRLALIPVWSWFADLVIKLAYPVRVPSILFDYLIWYYRTSAFVKASKSGSTAG